MLRITRDKTNGLTTLRLEGKLAGPWVQALRHEAQGPDAADRIQLDLSQIGFVDAEGVDLLRDLIREGAQIGNCSTFVQKLLNMEGSTP
jgi:ABC-type transporter Mla MlaB component